jgi:thiol-disulfide isomerase/thioredoxin
VAQVKEADVTKEIGTLRDLPSAQRSAATVKLAQKVATMPPGLPKIRLADSLAHLVTEGDQGKDTLQAVADVLSNALAESPVPGKDDKPSSFYVDLARQVRYLGVTTSLKDPEYDKAVQLLVDTDADIQKQDFTLKDMHNKPVTLSALKGKIVMVNFWATWCVPCRVEMPLLSALYDRFASQDLVVLSITDEDGMKTSQFLGGMKYHPPVLLDPGGTVHKQFHIHSIPATFIFDRDGKLIGQTIDQGSPKLFLTILSQTNLHP